MTHPTAFSKGRRTTARRGALRTVALALIGAVGLIACGPAWAQPAESQPAMSISRSWYLEAAIVAGMCGLALFVVCRSSRRN